MLLTTGVTYGAVTYRECYSQGVLLTGSVTHRGCYSQGVLLTGSVTHRGYDSQGCYSQGYYSQGCYSQGVLLTGGMTQRGVTHSGLRRLQMNLYIASFTMRGKTCGKKSVLCTVTGSGEGRGKDRESHRGEIKGRKLG